MHANNSVRSMIEEYFSITGRPISTLTVDEYGKFIKMASLPMDSPVMPLGNTQLNSENEEDTISNISAGTEDTIQGQSHSIIPIKASSSEAKNNLAGKNKASKEDMLKMMRSVGS